MFSKLVDMENNPNSLLYSIENKKKDVYIEFIKAFPDPSISAAMLRKYAEISKKGYRADSRVMENDIENVLVPYAKQVILNKYGFYTQETQNLS